MIGRYARIAVLALVAAAAAPTPDAAAQAPATDIEQESARLYRLGEAKFRAGEIEQAISAFEAGYKLSPRPEFLFNLAQCHRALGRRAETIRYLEQFVASAPDHAFRPQAETTLGELRRAAEEERRAQAQTQALLVREAPPPAPPPERASRRAWWIAGGLVLVAGTIGAVWYVRSRGDDGLGRVTLPPP